MRNWGINMISLFVTVHQPLPARLTMISGFVNVLIQFPQKPVLPNVKTSVLNLVQETASLIMKLAEQVNAQAGRHVIMGHVKAICRGKHIVAAAIRLVALIVGLQILMMHIVGKNGE